MLPAQQKDLFGHANQGGNYDKFRPVYPCEFVETILSHCDRRDNYLDVACGTGQLLFEIAQSFKKSYGIDISPKQIEVANTKVIQNNLSESVTVAVSDAHEVVGKLPQLEGNVDLVTIGQALHWFDVQKFFEEVKGKLLTQGQERYSGVFAVTGYFCRGFDFIAEDGSVLRTGDAIYDEFYNTVKDHFDCDRENLSKAYEGYNFLNHFQQIDRKELVTSTPCTQFDIAKYLQTYSAYNTLLEKKAIDKQFVDPILKFNKDVAAKIQIQENQTTPVSLKTSYFLRVFKAI